MNLSGIDDLLAGSMQRADCLGSSIPTSSVWHIGGNFARPGV